MFHKRVYMVYAIHLSNCHEIARFYAEKKGFCLIVSTSMKCRVIRLLNMWGV